MEKKTARLGVERLEDRCLLSNVELYPGGFLVVEGDYARNVIGITEGRNSICVKIRGEGVSCFDKADVSSVFVFGYDGNDKITAKTKTIPVYVDGGSGNDRIVTGAANDVVYGSDGNDTIAGGAGHDYLDGGSGRDRLAGNSGNDTIYGGYDTDTLNGGTGDDFLVDFFADFNRLNLAIGGRGFDTFFGDNTIIRRDIENIF